MTEDQKLDLILDTLEDLQTFIYSLEMSADNYINLDVSINDILENLNVKAAFTLVKRHMEDLEYLFVDIV